MTNGKRLWLVLLANLSMVLALVIVGLLSRSLGVLAAGGDYLGDTAGVALVVLALRISNDGTAHPGAATYPALANATFLLVVTIAVIVEGLSRLASGGPHVEGLPVMVVSVIAGLVMAGCAFVIGTVEDGDFNMRAVMLDTLADGISAAGVAASGAVILIVGGVYWLDSAVALGIAAIIAYHALKLIRDVLVHQRSAERLVTPLAGSVRKDRDLPERHLLKVRYGQVAYVLDAYDLVALRVERRD
jgi:cobalt-zinc-cadmium efflux system protein